MLQHYWLCMSLLKTLKDSDCASYGILLYFILLLLDTDDKFHRTIIACLMVCDLNASCWLIVELHAHDLLSYSFLYYEKHLFIVWVSGRKRPYITALLCLFLVHIHF